MKFSFVSTVIALGLGIASLVVLTVDPDSAIFQSAAVLCWIAIPLVFWFYRDTGS